MRLSLLLASDGVPNYISKIRVIEGKVSTVYAHLYNTSAIRDLCGQNTELNFVPDVTEYVASCHKEFDEFLLTKSGLPSGVGIVNVFLFLDVLSCSLYCFWT